MTTTADPMVLNEVDVELTLLGSLFMAPELVATTLSDIEAAWFGDPLCRYLFETVQKLTEQGSHLSHQAVLAALPDPLGPWTRKAFYGRVCDAAGPPTAMPGLVATLKDRWARRQLVAAAGTMQTDAVRIEMDPFELASEIVLSLDTINAHRAERRGGSLDGAMAKLDASLDHVDNLRGATTGLLALDNKLNGYKAGQLYVFAGRPGMGKSAYMCSSLRRTAQKGHGVAIFSLEMTEQEIAARMWSDALDSTKAPTFGSILRGQISDDERSDLRVATDSMSGFPLYLDDSPRLTFSEIAARARKQAAVFKAGGRKLDVLCIDHMGLITPSDRYRGNKVAEASEISGLCRSLAKELGCCVLLLCQLNRAVEGRDDKRPTLADLRWSGEIEQDAHVVAFLYRPAYYLAQDPNADPVTVLHDKYTLEVLIRKNRNGPPDDVRLWCSIAHSSIRDEGL